MAESRATGVFPFDGGDPAMSRAYEAARSTFRFFWREIIRDRGRIIPALDMSAVKAAFSDKDRRGEVRTEHMWLGDADFDGSHVLGTLLNAPDKVRSVKEGDDVRVPLNEISDWMFVLGDVVYGGFTVHLMRSRMGLKERDAHDNAWGQPFGDPASPVVPGDAEDATLVANLSSSLIDALAANPSLAAATGHLGWTLLHREASAGSTTTMRILLDAGADPHARTAAGLTPADLARALGWREAAAVLGG